MFWLSFKLYRRGHLRPTESQQRPMRYLIRVDHLLARSRSPLKYSRNFSANGLQRKLGCPPKPKNQPPEGLEQPPALERGGTFAEALEHYSSLPPLPPLGDWLSHFPYGSIAVRDRISIRNPLSAIHLAHSFVDTKKTSTGKPKVVIEAFPGALILSSREHAFPYSRPRSRCPLTGIPNTPAIKIKEVNNLRGP